MDDRIDDFMSRARKDKPIKADPTTGFHPDQLESYPLMRVGPKLYVAWIEGVAGNNYGEDAIVINSGDMSAYSNSNNPDPSEFSDSDVWYSVTLSEGNSFQGQARLTYANLDQFFEEKHYESLEYTSPDTTDLQPKSLFATANADIEEAAEALEGNDVTIHVTG